ncbi:hypothetical protein HMPREF1550_00590 [Actinomyces sp. oral taxon 877 str. F0543]|nr:hypothetical protein HMPREF1550_00590 [Actinomyces sp. oral taxon 877 str. F0543]
MVQNPSEFRPVQAAWRGGGPKCVSVSRLEPDPGEFGQTQTHFGPCARPAPVRAWNSDAFRTSRQATGPRPPRARALG